MIVRRPMITKFDLPIPAPKKKTRVYQPLQEQIDAFAQSDWPACEIDISEYKDGRSAYATWWRAVKDSGYGFHVSTRSGRVFMTRERRRVRCSDLTK